MALILPSLFAGTGILTGLFIGGCASIIFIIPFWMISKKAGFSPWWSLLFIFPLAGLVYIWVLGFSDWPSQRNTRNGS